MPRLILGLVGRRGAGKGSVARLLDERYGARVVRFSAILEDILTRLSIEKTRAHFVTLSETLRHAFGEDILQRALLHEISEDTHNIIVLDGVRRIDDLSSLQTQKNFHLLSIESSLELRYARMKQRSEKVGEAQMSLEEFETLEQAPTERTIAEVEQLAWRRIQNNGTLEQLTEQLDGVLKDLECASIQSII
jgi:dephospho-CoA kinase